MVKYNPNIYIIPEIKILFGSCVNFVPGDGPFTARKDEEEAKRLTKRIGWRWRAAEAEDLASASGIGRGTEERRDWRVW